MDDQTSLGPTLGMSTVHQPKAKTQQQPQVQGQLAMFMRNRLDWDVEPLGGSTSVKDINRSTSAPPTQQMLADQGLADMESLEMSDPRLDPNYPAFYMQHSRLDHRLPPPIYSPGQSWQLWAPPGINKQRVGQDLIDQATFLDKSMDATNLTSQQSFGELPNSMDPRFLEQALGPGASGRSSRNANMLDPRMAGSGVSSPVWLPDGSGMNPQFRGNLSGFNDGLGGSEFNRIASQSGLLGRDIFEDRPGSTVGGLGPSSALNAMSAPPKPGTISNADILLLREQMRAEYLEEESRMAASMLLARDELNGISTNGNANVPGMLKPNSAVGSNMPTRSASTPPNHMYARDSINLRALMAERAMLGGDPSLNNPDILTQMRNLSIGGDDELGYGPPLQGRRSQPSYVDPQTGRFEPPRTTKSPRPAMDPYNSLSAKDIQAWELRQQAAGILPSSMGFQDDYLNRSQTSSNQMLLQQAGFPYNSPVYAGIGSNSGNGSLRNSRGSVTEPSAQSIMNEQKLRMLAAQQQQLLRKEQMIRREYLHNLAATNNMYQQQIPLPGTSGSPGPSSQQRRNGPNFNPADPTSSASDTTRSPLLEDFRNSKNKKFELRDIIGCVVEFSGDQHGSRFIQQKLESTSNEEKQVVFDEITPHALQLMTDVFGNYVIQKFLEYGTQKQKQTLVKQMEGQILTLSLQMYGCRVVQKALEHVQPQEQAIIVKELEGNVLKCVKDQNGNHVIQKAIERVPAEHIQFVIQAFHGQVFALATHPYGCRVIQRIFEFCADEDGVNQQPAHIIGVIQHILERGKPADKTAIMSKVRGQVLQLSKHKFASNVVEKCVTFGSKKERQLLIDEIVSIKPDGTCALNIMMKDQFANYVVQKMLDVVDNDQRDLLVVKIRPHLQSLKKYTYGKHLITKVEKLTQQGVVNIGDGSNFGYQNRGLSPDNA